MTELAFVLGNNWLLSMAELLVHLQDRGLDAHIVDHSRNAVIVGIKESLNNGQLIDIQSALGGCYKVGRVITRYDKRVAERAFPSKGRIVKSARRELMECFWVPSVWRKLSNKRVKFGVSTYPTMRMEGAVSLERFTLGLDEWIKQKLVELGAKKAVYYAYEEPDRRDARRPNTALWPSTIARHNLLSPPNAEILAMFTEKNLYLAKTVAVYDSQLQKYRDEERPYIASEITTSPKMCRTLLNLAGARKGDTVLDPFCGSGTLLMEAALLDMKCIGIDINGNAVQGAISNLRWLEGEMDDKIEYRIIKGDSRNLERLLGEKVDAIAFEPDLGPVLKSKPTRAEAVETIKHLTKMYNEVLHSAVKVLRPGGRVAMTLPVINTTQGQITVEPYLIIRGTGLDIRYFLPSKLVKTSKAISQNLSINPDRDRLPERKQGQIVQRTVSMFERI